MPILSVSACLIMEKCVTVESIPEIWSSGPWAEFFDFKRRLGNGGQGFTFCAEKKSDGSLVTIKILKKDSKKSRRRMLREVSALKALTQTSAKVPNFIDSNIDEVLENSTIKPYLCMEYVEGTTLGNAQQSRGPLSIGDAVDFTLRILDIVDIAHSEDTAHRDIKPQNIVLKSDDYTEPYLIDFGLSFNKETDLTDDLTTIHEAVGNRFLRLAESEQTGSHMKHEFTSDLTLVSGIFFYLLTDKFPRYLSMDGEKSPQGRYSEIIQKKHREHAVFLRQFFDRAFQFDLRFRFQSGNELRDRLLRVKDQVEGLTPEVNPLSVTREVRGFIESNSRDYQLDKIEGKFDQVLVEFLKYVLELTRSPDFPPVKLSRNDTTFGKRLYLDREVIRKSLLEFWLSIPSYSEKSAYCRYYLVVDGSEVSVAFQELSLEEKRKAGEPATIFNSVEFKEIISFHEWDVANNAVLIKHFNHWFYRAVEIIKN